MRSILILSLIIILIRSDENHQNKNVLTLSTGSGEIRIVCSSSSSSKVKHSELKDFWFVGASTFYVEAKRTTKFRYENEDGLHRELRSEDLYEYSSTATINSCRRRGDVYFVNRDKLRICLKTTGKGDFNGSTYYVGYVNDTLSWDAIHDISKKRYYVHTNILSRPVRILDVFSDLKSRLEPRKLERISSDFANPDMMIRNFVSKGKPVVIEGFAQHYGWNALKNWTPENFRKYHGSKPVVFRNPYHPKADANLNGKVTSLTMSEFLDSIRSETIRTQRHQDKILNYVVSMVNLFAQPPFRDLLRDDVVYEPFFESTHDENGVWKIEDIELHPDNPLVWIGPNGTHATMHHDARTTMYVQIHGRKRFLSVRAEMRDLVCPNSYQRVYSDVNYKTNEPLLEADLDRYCPEFRRATIYESFLDPGDLLILPAGVWHDVVCEDNTSVCVSLSMVAFQPKIQEAVNVWSNVVKSLGFVLKYRSDLVMSEKHRGKGISDEGDSKDSIPRCIMESEFEMAVRAYDVAAPINNNNNNNEFWVTNKDLETILVLRVMSRDFIEAKQKSRVVMANSFAIVNEFSCNDFISIRNYITKELLTFLYPRCQITTRMHITYQGCERSWSPLGINMFPRGLDSSNYAAALQSGIGVLAYLEYDTCDEKEEEFRMTKLEDLELLLSTFHKIIAGIPRMRTTTTSKIVSEGTRIVREVLRRDHVDVLVIQNDMNLPTLDVLKAANHLVESGITKAWGMFSWSLSRVSEVFLYCDVVPQTICPEVYVTKYPDFRSNDEIERLYRILSEKRVRIVVSVAKKCLGSIYDTEREKLEALGRDIGVSVDVLIQNYVISEHKRVKRNVLVLVSRDVSLNTAEKSISKEYLSFVRVPSLCLKLLCEEKKEIEEDWTKYSCASYLPSTQSTTCNDLPSELRKFAMK